MNNRIKNTLAATALALAGLLAGPALATPVTGTALDPDDNPIPSGDGWYDFYIPLSGSEQYDGSLNPDTCINNGGCTGGTLEMVMHFDLGWSGATEFTFDFSDLDVVGFGDNDYFFEVLGIGVFDGDGNLLMQFSEAEIAALLTGDSGSQQLVLSLDVDGPVYFSLIFGTGFDDAPHYAYRNTLESIRGTAVSVPEPGTLALLGAGLLILAFSQRRRRMLAKF